MGAKWHTARSVHRSFKVSLVQKRDQSWLPEMKMCTDVVSVCIFSCRKKKSRWPSTIKTQSLPSYLRDLSSRQSYGCLTSTRGNPKKSCDICTVKMKKSLVWNTTTPAKTWKYHFVILKVRPEQFWANISKTIVIRHNLVWTNYANSSWRKAVTVKTQSAQSTNTFTAATQTWYFKINVRSRNSKSAQAFWLKI